MIDLTEKRVAIVGAKRLGAAVARQLHASGARCALLYRRSREPAEALAHALGGAPLLQADLAEEDQVEAALDSACAALGGLDFAICAASDFHRTPLPTLDGAAWDRGMRGAKGAYLFTLHAARRMARNPGPTRGHVLLYGDWAAGETPYPHYLPYLTSKAAVHFLIRGFAMELAPLGVLVNGLAPGPTARPPELPPAAWERLVQTQTPLQRESSAEELAALALTLLRSETITGELIRVDAGRHLRGVVPTGA